MYLFQGDWSNKDQLYRAFKKVRDFCGYGEDYVWHSLRHSFGTSLGETTHPRTIMELMGHADVETSLRYVTATVRPARARLAPSESCSSATTGARFRAGSPVCYVPWADRANPRCHCGCGGIGRRASFRY